MLTYRPDLQGLRALAILAILFVHAGFEFAPGGFVGVDVFFVLSGYLITGLLIKEFAANGRIDFTRFYARRLKRLLPALALMLCVSGIAAICLLSAVEAREQLGSGPYASLWASNLYFSFREFDYFNELASKDLFLHTWSLGVEEQFYLLWPMLLLGLMLFAARVSGKVSRQTILLWGLLMFAAASFSLEIYWMEVFPHAAFYLMPARIWQFSLGALVFLYCNRHVLDSGSGKIELSAGASSFCLILGLVLIVGSIVLLDAQHAYPGFWALLPSLGSALVILSGETADAGAKSILAHPLLGWFGDRSYSLYLWHWPILVLGSSVGYKSGLVPTFALLALVVVFSLLSYSVVERPFWKGALGKYPSPRIIFSSLGVIMFVVVAFALALRQLPELDSEQDISNQWRTDVPRIYLMPCDTPYESAELRPCVFGSDSAEKTVVLVGDSVVGQWFSMVPATFPPPEWRTLVLTKSACPMVDEDIAYEELGGVFTACREWRTAVLDKLDMLKPDVVIMGSSTTYQFSPAQWTEGGSRIVARVSKAAKDVIILAGTPTLGFDGPGCVARNMNDSGGIDAQACVAKGRVKEIEQLTSYMESVSRGFSNAHFLNLNDIVCPQGLCRAVSTKGSVVYRDSKHVTDTFVRSETPAIRERIKELIDN